MNNNRRWLSTDPHPVSYCYAAIKKEGNSKNALEDYFFTVAQEIVLKLTKIDNNAKCLDGLSCDQECFQSKNYPIPDNFQAPEYQAIIIGEKNKKNQLQSKNFYTNLFICSLSGGEANYVEWCKKFLSKEFFKKKYTILLQNDLFNDLTLSNLVDLHDHFENQGFDVNIHELKITQALIENYFFKDKPCLVEKSVFDYIIKNSLLGSIEWKKFFFSHYEDNIPLIDQLLFLPLSKDHFITIKGLSPDHYRAILLMHSLIMRKYYAVLLGLFTLMSATLFYKLR